MAIDVNWRYRWFLDRQPSEAAFEATTCTPKRQQLDEHGLSRAFFDAVVRGLDGRLVQRAFFGRWDVE